MRDDLENRDATGAGVHGQSSPAHVDAAVDATISPPPLHWWRTFPASAFTPGCMETLAGTLSPFIILGEPRWKAAVAGDATAAIGIALRLTRDCRNATPVVDIAMTALLQPAIARDPAVALVLAKILKRMVGRPTGQRLAASWLAHADLPPDEYGHLARLTFHPAADVDPA